MCNETNSLKKNSHQQDCGVGFGVTGVVRFKENSESELESLFKTWESRSRESE